MGAEDTERQALNVYRMELLGARVHPVTSGTATLKDATSEAMREWSRRADDTFYVIGSTMGPHPYPMIVRDFQRVIGDEIRSQMLETCGRLPAALIACVGGGSNAMGTFYPFLNDRAVRLIGAEAGGEGLETGRHAATMTAGSLGVFHGMHSLFLQDDDGQIKPVYSISAGSGLSGHRSRACLSAGKPARRVSCGHRPRSRRRRLPGWPASKGSFRRSKAPMPWPCCARWPQPADFGPDDPVVVTLSGRGDKDVAAIQAWERQHAASAAADPARQSEEQTGG